VKTSLLTQFMCPSCSHTTKSRGHVAFTLAYRSNHTLPPLGILSVLCPGRDWLLKCPLCNPAHRTQAWEDLPTQTVPQLHLSVVSRNPVGSFTAVTWVPRLTDR
jgi:hypothetical protein